MTHPYTVQLNRTGSRVQVSDPQGRAYLLTPDQARSMARELTRLADESKPIRPSRRRYGNSRWQHALSGNWFSTSHPGYALHLVGTWHLVDPNGHRIDLDVTSLRSAFIHAYRFLPEPVDTAPTD